jgi:UDP-N-acetylbacillosamine N-acetyltransferase
MSNKNQGILLIGCGGHARFILSILYGDDYKVAGLIDLGESFNSEEVIMDTPVIGCRHSLPQFRNQGFEVVILAIGDNTIRKELYAEVVELGFKLPCIIHSSAIVDESVLMGIGNVIGPNVIIGAEVKIGSNNIINSAAMVEHQSVIGSHCHISLSSILCGAVNIGDGVFIGANSTVIDKTYIANNTIVGAGTNVIRSIHENNTTFVGNPGRVIRK